MRDVIHFESLPKPRFRYSPCVKAGPFYHMAGLIALDGDSGKLVPGGAYEQTKNILGKAQTAARELGLTMKDLVSATIYVSPFSDFPHVNKAWEELFTADVPPPARTSIGVAALPLDAKVEIEFRFYKP